MQGNGRRERNDESSVLLSDGLQQTQEDVVAQLLDDLSHQLNNHHIGLLASARTFVPDIIAEAIANENLPEDRLIVSRCEGAVVFSDASGFTALTERLALYSNGAELLSSSLNNFFTPLIDMLTAYRGDVIKFSGDALTILFAAANDNDDFVHACGSPSCIHGALELACLRASACCIEIHKRLHNFDTGEGGVRLTLHIGVGAGPVTILQVGGDKGRYEYVIAGQPLEQIAVAEPLAGSGETVLSPECWVHVVNTVVEGEPIKERPDYHRLVGLDISKHTYPTIKQAAQQSSSSRKQENPTDQDLERCLAAELRFIPQCVVKQFRTGSLKGINEMRTVSIIFAQIGGVDVSTDEGAEIAQQLVSGMQALCYAEEGNLNKFLVDDKGLLFLFVFGLPPLVHIDDPSRACRACLEMSLFLQKMGLTGRLGITTGRVFCGIVGSNTRREYTVMGDTVNLSARLMANAKANTVLVDDATFQRCQRDFSFVKLRPIKVKGKEKEITIYRPLHSDSRAQEGHAQDGEILDKPPAQSYKICVRRSAGQTVQIKLPWPPKGTAFGGKSLVAEVKSWTALDRVHMMVNTSLTKGGGIIVLCGDSGCGKEELAESVIKVCVQQKKMLPLFATMEMRAKERWAAVREIMTRLLMLLHNSHGGCDMTDEVSEDDFVELLEKEDLTVNEREAIVLMESEIRGRSMTTASSGFRHMLSHKSEDARAVSGDNIGAGQQNPTSALRKQRASKRVEINETPQSVMMPVCSLVKRLLAKLLQGPDRVVLVMRCWRRTTLFPCDDTIFWELVRQLGDLAVSQEPGKLLVLVLCRIPPIIRAEDEPRIPGSPAARASVNSSASAELSAAHTKIEVEPLTDEEAHIFIGLVLGVGHGGNTSEAVPEELAEWLSSITLNNPSNMQEVISQLVRDDKIQVHGGSVKVKVDLNSVDIAAWVHTGMVGSIISQIEVMDAEAQRVIKMASVLDGPLSALDIAAANRAHRPDSDLLAFYDSVQLLLSCEWLVEQDFLKHFKCDDDSDPPDCQSRRLPRWEISNLLIRKVVASTLLQSQKMLMKRAVLLTRALNIHLPAKMQEKAQRREEMFGKQSKAEKNRLQKRREAAWEMQAAAPNGLVESTYAGLPSSCIVLPMVAAVNMGICIPEHDSVCDSLSSKMVPLYKQKLQTSDSDRMADWLHLMASAAQKDRVAQLLEKGVPVSVKDATGLTALHFACGRGDLELVKLLVQARADIREAAPGCGTALDLAVTHGQLEIVQYLVAEDSGAILAAATSPAAHWAEKTSELDSNACLPMAPVPALDHDLPFASRLEHANYKRSQVLMFLQDVVSFDEEEHQADLLRSEVANSSSAGSVRQKSAHINLSPGASVQREFKQLSYLRKFLNSKAVSFATAVCVLVALFAPDLWVIFGGKQDALDSLLVTAMLLLLIEIFLSFIIEPGYVKTLFFSLDMIGTLALAFDISWLLGSSWKDPMEADNPLDGRSGSYNVVVARAARCAEVGTRGARYSWIARLFNTLCICCLNPSEIGDYGGVEFFRRQLMHSISTHVAGLSVSLIMLVPLLNFMTHPKEDLSMAAWTEVLSGYVQENASMLQSEFAEFEDFYEQLTYGPYYVCSLGQASDCASRVWGVDRHDDDFQFSRPSEAAARLQVNSNYLGAFFDFTTAREREAWMNICLMLFMIFVMVFTTFFISRAISDLVLRPLQRMLKSVKQIAQPIFETTSLGSIDEEDEDAEMYDDEVYVLLKVVQKLGKIAGIAAEMSSVGKNPESMQGLHDEDRGVLQMMFQQDKAEAKRNSSNESSGEMSVYASEASLIPSQNSGDDPKLVEAMKRRLEKLKISYDELDSWDFNVTKIERQVQIGVSGWILMQNTSQSSSSEIQLTPEITAKFLQTVFQNYSVDPDFHNWAHAVDVIHTVWRMMHLSKAHAIFSGIEQFALLVSAISHDIGHLGVNNQFLVETGHELAVRYNDRSPLENMHCARMFEIVSGTPGANVFASLSRANFWDVRRICIAVILHTDNVHHFEMVKETQMLYQLNSDAFEQESQSSKDVGKEDRRTQTLTRILADRDTKQKVLNLYLHSADISNPCKPWTLCYEWAMRCLAEFFQQGDQEKALGIPVQMLNDRQKVNKAYSQIGFIEIMIVPLEAAKTRLLPALSETSKILEDNLHKWNKMWTEETMPSEEDKEKVAARIKRASDSLAQARPAERPIYAIRASVD